MCPVHAAFLNLSRYHPDRAKPFAYCHARAFDVVSRHQAAMTRVLRPEREQAVMADTRFIPKRVKPIPATL
jgi:hypothetical protein